MSAPTFETNKSPIKNMQALLRSLSISSIATTLEAAVAQLLSYIHTTALALDGTLSVGSTLSVTGMTTLTGGLKGGVQALSAAGAVNLTTLVTTIASGGAIALTLADGAAGQIKVISMITDGGDATLTPTNLQGGTTIVFGDVGDTVTLVFVGTKWAVVGNTGATIA